MLHRRTGKATRQGAFSLVELVMVVIIISIVAAIAIPRFSQASASSEESALLANLNNVRQAIDLYYAEHGRFPGYDPDTGTPSDGDFLDQLLLYSNSKGETAASLGGGYLYGPYLRRPFPTNPINGLATVKVRAKRSGKVANGSSGWIATLEDGSFDINAMAADLTARNIDATLILKEEEVGALIGG